MADFNRCPECGQKIFRDDFQCAHCGLLLHPEQATGEYILTEPSIVRALISPSEARTGEIPAVLDEEFEEVITETFQIPVADELVPELVAKLDVALNPLHPFEALVASFIDGKSSVRQLQKLSGIPPVELKAVLATLNQRGIVELREQVARPAKKTSRKAAPQAWPTNLQPTPSRAPSKPREPAPPPSPQRNPPSRAIAAPIEDVPTNPKRKRPVGAFSKALDELPRSGAHPAPPPPGNSVRRERVEKALEEAKNRRSAPLQERAPELPDRPEEYLQRAIALEREGKVDGAIYVLNRAIAQVKKPGPLYNKLALILLNQRKDYREAEVLLRKALAAEPGNMVYQQNLYTVLGLAAEHKSGKHNAGGLWAKLRGK